MAQLIIDTVKTRTHVLKTVSVPYHKSLSRGPPKVRSCMLGPILPTECPAGGEDRKDPEA